ncbi:MULTISPECIES: flagellar hook-basal body protein [unclassified Psychrobacillus]|uniref:flagellar hook-basal body protein n=1 Tax=unclassified Psychrobacillus TaxID=2636677 RepID=UPI00146B9ECB|nr:MULTISPECIES: flagellar hook-basal body protein [unclassified Psychrobacillus]MCM3356457.1 flagellar hook-basal body protein [Psychrobacillus sp. MER TA 171]NME05752.1 flagellar hook-basal body protein [Psychrobacillus sp. BL-248-WT-3]
MFRGFNTVASGMIAQQRRTELLTNNMANANTPGFKADQSTIRSFPDMLMSRLGPTKIPTENPISGKSLSTVGGISTGVYMSEIVALQTQGQLKQTDLNTDLALIDGGLPVDAESGKAGALFFRLEHPAGGEAYTRNGNFTLDAAGFLTNAQGLYVLNSSGQRIQMQNDDFRVGDDGQIYVDNESVSQIGVSFAATPDRLVKQDNGLFRTEDGNELPSAYDNGEVSFAMQQGYIEGSNVDTAKTMTELMSAYRTFEANQKILQAYDQSMQKTVNEVGRV